MRFRTGALPVLVCVAARAAADSNGGGPMGSAGNQAAGYRYTQQGQAHHQQQQQQWTQQPQYNPYQQARAQPIQQEKLASTAGERSGNDTVLPAGWTEHRDPASGRMYYYHAADGITTWTRPVMPEENGGSSAGVEAEGEEKQAAELVQHEVGKDEEPQDVENITKEEHPDAGADIHRTADRETSVSHGQKGETEIEDETVSSGEVNAAVRSGEQPQGEDLGVHGQIGPPQEQVQHSPNRKEQNDQYDSLSKQQQALFFNQQQPHQQQQPYQQQSPVQGQRVPPHQRSDQEWRRQQDMGQQPWRIPHQDPSRSSPFVHQKDVVPVQSEGQKMQHHGLPGGLHDHLSSQRQSAPSQPWQAQSSGDRPQKQQHEPDKGRQAQPGRQGYPLAPPQQRLPHQHQRMPPTQGQHPPWQQQQQQHQQQQQQHQQQQQQHQQQQQIPSPYNQYGQQYPGYGQYGQYGAQSGQSQQQGSNQLVTQGNEAGGAVRDALGRTWQSVLGFGNRTKEVVGTAKDTVVSSASTAGQSIGSTSVGIWGRARSRLNQVGKAVFESSDDGTKGQDSYSLSQYGVPPPPRDQQQQQGYPPQQYGSYPGYGTPAPRGAPPYPHQGQGMGQQGPPMQSNWGGQQPRQQQQPLGGGVPPFAPRQPGGQAPYGQQRPPPSYPPQNPGRRDQTPPYSLHGAPRSGQEQPGGQQQGGGQPQQQGQQRPAASFPPQNPEPRDQSPPFPPQGEPRGRQEQQGGQQQGGGQPQQQGQDPSQHPGWGSGF